MENQTIQIQSQNITDGNPKGILSQSVLKLIAIISMLIDHIGLAVLYPVLVEKNPDFTGLYETMRYIGRLAFPIFSFFLVVGFVKTRHICRYAIRLGIFAILSEICFDLAFSDTLFDFSSQNVFFTLFIALLVMIGLDYFGAAQKTNYTLTLSLKTRAVLRLLILAAGVAAAYFLKTDYSFYGIMFIIILYQLKDQPKLCLIIGALLSLYFSPTAPLAFLLIALYNGKRGFGMKYFFYLFYPLHLLLLWAVRLYLM